MWEKRLYLFGYKRSTQALGADGFKVDVLFGIERVNGFQKPEEGWLARGVIEVLECQEGVQHMLVVFVGARLSSKYRQQSICARLEHGFHSVFVL